MRRGIADGSLVSIRKRYETRKTLQSSVRRVGNSIGTEKGGAQQGEGDFITGESLEKVSKRSPTFGIE